MSKNFDLSKIDDDEYLANLENDEDYSNRQVYDRSYSPPSPSLLDSLAHDFDDSDNEENSNESPIVQPLADALSKQNIPSKESAFVAPFKSKGPGPAKNPFGNDSVIKVEGDEEEEDPLILLQKIEAYNQHEVTDDSIKNIQALIIKYFMVCKRFYFWSQQNGFIFFGMRQLMFSICQNIFKHDIT